MVTKSSMCLNSVITKVAVSQPNFKETLEPQSKYVLNIEFNNNPKNTFFNSFEVLNTWLLIFFV
jgi:hypothetical protein